ncbi:MAG: DNA cytosine methyltransferase [Kiritimatiellae bacterium]|nr:DNA cytosine methyltransferase [Kiritimatiellia bacterium]
MSDITCLDLFCGAGGLSCGLHMAGIKTVAGIDFDQAAINTFNANGLGKGVVADLEEITSEEVKKLCGGKVDIIAGGPPCQGFSLSGFRDESDKRNRLYKSFVRIVRDLQPKAFVLENVPGLVSLFGGRVKDAIVTEFSALGYNVTHKILTASEYGVPQHRRRVVFVGLRNKVFNYPKVTHFKEPENSSQKKMISCVEALGDLPPLSRIDELGVEKQAYATAAKCEYQRHMRKGSKVVHNHIAARHSDKVRSIIAMVPAGKNYKSLPESLRSVRNFHVAWTRFPDDEPSPTIDTGHRHHFHYKECRVPTVRECARLQSFPDTFHFTGNKTQQFRQVGNAVPPLMAKALGEALKEALNE